MYRAVAAALVCLAPLALAAQPADLPARVDRIFARFDRGTPGCVVGIGKDGRMLYARGYGAANLEYGVPLTDSSVMESGSVAKQFTAAALVLLQQDGALSLDDDIRKHLPEVPDFGHRITIRHLLTHTSGLRDQWGLLGLEGRGPGTQVHSPETTLDLVVRQRALNFPPGSRYLYSNTGYALSALIIQRVSGKSLQAFSQERLFGPLGMTHTRWRDDHTEVVRNRATAYSPSATGFRTNMPFTNMVGNGGLLSTMSDLLKWNANLDRTTVGGPRFTETMQAQMRLANGRMINYALGLQHDDYDGVREIGHGGSTAGYRTYLARYPDQRVSIAVWCSNATANASALTRQVADLVLVKPPRTAGNRPVPAVRLARAELTRWAGAYRDPFTDGMMQVTATDSTLVVNGNQVFTPIGDGRFRGAGATAAFSRVGNRRAFVMARADGDSARLEEVPLAGTVRTGDYTGRYASDEVNAEFTVLARGGGLFLRRRPFDEIALRPTYADGFQAPGVGSVRFLRDENGAVIGFGVFAGRILDVRFRKLP